MASQEQKASYQQRHYVQIVSPKHSKFALIWIGVIQKYPFPEFPLLLIHLAYDRGGKIHLLPSSGLEWVLRHLHLRHPLHHLHRRRLDLLSPRTDYR